jgi:hypothetical protein
MMIMYNEVLRDLCRSPNIVLVVQIKRSNRLDVTDKK